VFRASSLVPHWLPLLKPALETRFQARPDDPIPGSRSGNAGFRSSKPETLNTRHLSRCDLSSKARNPKPQTRAQDSEAEASPVLEPEIGSRCWGWVSKFSVSGCWFRASRFEFRASCLGLRASDFGFRIPSLGFRVSSLVFRVPGSGLRA
jgi:hypothetical protein